MQTSVSEASSARLHAPMPSARQSNPAESNLQVPENRENGNESNEGRNGSASHQQFETRKALVHQGIGLECPEGADECRESAQSSPVGHPRASDIIPSQAPALILSGLIGAWQGDPAHGERPNDILSNEQESISSASSVSSSIYSSSYDTSSISSSTESSSVLTSSLSSFEFSLSIPIQGGQTRETIHAATLQHDEGSESSYEDEIANLISSTMEAHGLALGQALAERASCIDSIKWLGQHLPETVVQFLIDEIEVEEAVREPSSPKGSNLVSSVGYDGVGTALTPTSIPSENGRNESGYGRRERPGGCHANDDEGSFSLGRETSDSEDDLSMTGPLHHHQENSDEQESYHLRRRHSVIGGASMKESTDGELSNSTRRNRVTQIGEPRCIMRRRASMPLILRSLEGSTGLAPNRGSIGFASHYRRSSIGESSSSRGDNSETGAKNRCVPSMKQNRNTLHDSEELGSETSVNSASMTSILFQKQSLGIVDSTFKPAAGQPYLDPFPFDSDDEKQKVVRLREHRVMKTIASIQNLATLDKDYALNLDDFEDESKSDFYFTDSIPPATRHDCALLFVDISGFTKLSTTLGVEPLSKVRFYLHGTLVYPTPANFFASIKTINSYFQKIVDMVEAFGGDVLKFAGDALFAEWQATASSPLESGENVSLTGNSQCSIEPWHGLGLEECVLTAAACGARIVDECSDYPVYESGGTSGKLVTTLNVHCGVGFGEVVGVHVGDKESRMEYLILGDPIEQVAEAIEVANRGEVVASPEALVILEETAILDPCILESNMDKPQVIVTKSTCFFRPKGTARFQQDWTLTLQDFTTKPRERLAKRCDDWDLEALKRLKQRISLYVHPVVVNDEFAMKVYPGDRSRAQERHRSEAELRGVFTVFIMPLITARLTGDDQEDCKLLVLLNDMMLIMTRELARFKGQMRQFIVDDKGVVLIANFGLRGSTFPNMVAERAIPFTTTFQSLLKAELNTECQMGATYGMAYCGVVGGVARHEYAVLGPSVNLAARLMANPDNRGFLVDGSVKDKAGSRQFRPLPPVRAKGYADLVPIFEPMQVVERSWKDISSRFVGRGKELAEMITIAEDILDSGGPSRFVLVSGEAGAGKSSLWLQTTKQIRDLCVSRALPHLILRNAFSEGDLFVPFSLARPIFLDILVHLQALQDADRDEVSRGLHDSSLGLASGSQKGESAESLSVFVRICESAEIPVQYIDIMARLIVTRSRADPVVEDDISSASNAMMMNSIAQYLAKAFLQCTIACDMVVLALDDVSQMDSMSWKVVELLYSHSQNLMIIGTTRPMTQNQAMHADPEWWESLHNVDNKDKKFVEMELCPMHLSDVEALIANSLGRRESEIDPRISREVYVQSGGMPNLASEILENLYKRDMVDRYENGVTAGNDEVARSPGLDVGNIGELVLHRMDSLPSSVRTHLNLGAILGSSFELMDVITVFEQYRCVKKEERLVHAKSVHESIDEAVRKGILEVSDTALHSRYGSSDHPYASLNLTYKFTHDVWRSNILRLTLDEWKRDMHSLIAQSMETVMDTEFADDYRLLTKLFCHWKESGSAEKAATLALKMGRSLENIGLIRQGLVVYHESLDMWKAMDSDGEPDESIGGKCCAGVNTHFCQQLIMSLPNYSQA